MGIGKQVREMVAVAIVTGVSLAANTAYGQSAAECSARADRAARDATGVVGGAVTGGLGGAAFGAIVGNSKSARRGAALGAVVGGAAGAHNRNEVYKQAYDRCMRGY